MTIQFSVDIQNARNDAVEAITGPTAVLKIRTGAQPATCASADTGISLSTMLLPTDWMANSSAGVKALLGSWTQEHAEATGYAGHFRIYKNGGVTCCMQGSVTATSGGGDLELSSIYIESGYSVTITACNFTDGNP